MKIGDLVRFCPEAWGTPLKDRPLGVVVEIELSPRGTNPLVDVLFPTDDIPYSSNIKDFEVVNENW